MTDLPPEWPEGPKGLSLPETKYVDWRGVAFASERDGPSSLSNNLQDAGVPDDDQTQLVGLQYDNRTERLRVFCSSLPTQEAAAWAKINPDAPIEVRAYEMRMPAEIFLEQFDRLTVYLFQGDDLSHRQFEIKEEVDLDE